MNPVYSVTQVSLYIKNLFTRDGMLARIVVEGEVSNCKYHSSGHIYFTLKDAGAQLKCVMFAASRERGLGFVLKDGAKVQVLGRISVFERDGVYQMYAERIVLAGLGELYERFEELKKKLYAEGLFDEAHKKQIPLYPKKIGIVTARTGAALQDILNILHRRNPYVQPILAPARVQGEGAAQTVVHALHILENAGVDVIIVGRGGGSIEDLWAFNEEIVARAVYQCPIPVISCVGHETDTTMIDYVSDLRAPTPSAAAEIAVRESGDIDAALVDLHSGLTGAMLSILERYRENVRHMEQILSVQKPMAKLERKREQAEVFEQRLHAAMERRVRKARNDLEVLAAKLDGKSPLKKLSGGFGFVSNEEHVPVTTVEMVECGDKLHITLCDGEIQTEVKGLTKWQKK